MRAPQLGKVRDKRDYFGTNVPPGPNPEATKGLRVKPFANVFALVDGLGVISLHRDEADAKTALDEEIERRKRFNERSGEGVKPAAPAEAHEAHEAEADR